MTCPPQRTAARPLVPQRLCRHLDPRRLRPPNWYYAVRSTCRSGSASASTSKTSHAVSEVREAVKQRLRDLLAPIYPQAIAANPATRPSRLAARKDVLAQELLAEASRVPGVLLRTKRCWHRQRNGPKVLIVGLQLPQVLGTVQVGNALPLDELRGQLAEGGSSGNQVGKRMPVPFVPTQC